MLRSTLTALVLGMALYVMPVNADTRCVQEFLSNTAFDPGPVDGLWGRKTAAAASAFLGQVEAEGQFEVSRDSVGALCAFMTGERRDELLIAARYRVYSIELSPESLPDSFGKTRFDFSAVSVNRDLNSTCLFTFFRKPKEHTRSDMMASGWVNIQDGKLYFDEEHEWRTGGLAESSYLIEEANLAVQDDGMVVGKTPYFHLFINQGEVALQPEYVELAFKYEPSNRYPNGRSWFYVDDWQDAFIELTCFEQQNE